MVNFGCDADGGAICTVKDGKLVTLKLLGCVVFYFKRGNLFLDISGNMDEYYETIYSFLGGGFKAIHKGTYGAADNANIQFDKNGDPIYEYYWDGKKVSYSAYQDSLSAAFDQSKAIDTESMKSDAAKIIAKIKAFRY